jgi:hypothetical protein
VRRISFLIVILAALSVSVPVLAGAIPATRSDLYFGLDLAGGGAVGEDAWADFLGEIVTPRFPDGFTVIDAYGQWRDPAVANAPIIRERTKLIVIVRPATKEADAAVAEIKSIYKKRFGQISVFHTDAPVEIVE